MPYKYEDAFDATKPDWMAQVKAYLDKGKQVVVCNLEPNQERDCIALAQEHDFTCTVEDKGEALAYIKANYSFNPQVRPKVLGFVHRDDAKRIRY